MSTHTEHPDYPILFVAKTCKAVCRLKIIENHKMVKYMRIYSRKGDNYCGNCGIDCRGNNCYDCMLTSSMIYHCDSQQKHVMREHIRNYEEDKASVTKKLEKEIKEKYEGYIIEKQGGRCDTFEPVEYKSTNEVISTLIIIADKLKIRLTTERGIDNRIELYYTLMRSDAGICCYCDNKLEEDRDSPRCVNCFNTNYPSWNGRHEVNNLIPVHYYLKRVIEEYMKKEKYDRIKWRGYENNGEIFN